jgi:saccharopine dehydrogenase-like NADP-dependent oxidoreductase
MGRIVVCGGRGFFGGAAVELLQRDGLEPVVASRRTGLDVEAIESIRRTLQPGDVVIDAVGPFQDRSTTLVRAATEIGFDVIDISDSLAYCRRVWELGATIGTAGIRVLTACSSIAAVSAMLVAISGIKEPIRITESLSPAARHVAHPGVGESLLRSVGRPIEVLIDGALISEPGWRRSRDVVHPQPIGRVRGYLFETADGFLLPHVFPTIRTVEFFVNTNTPGVNAIFSLAARSRAFRALVTRGKSQGLILTRLAGSRYGCFAVEIEGSRGEKARLTVFGRVRAYLTPVVPTVVAAERMVAGTFEPVGLVPPDKHVEPTQLLEYLRSLNIEVARDG